MKPAGLFSVISLSALGAYGWGVTGHQAVGYVAMQFLAPNALKFVQTSLGTTYSQSLGPAATWADIVKYQEPYKWSAVLHYVDAQDNPPTSCSVDENRDCSDGQCILAAIANYTTRVVDATLSDDQRQEALMFLDHFLGDITQPLHVEAASVGGNTISSQCNGAKTNLHAAWDTGMIQTLVPAKYGNSTTTWAEALAARIKTGEYQSVASSWISCSSTTQPGSTRNIADDIAGLLRPRSITLLECPLVWARDSNTLDCSYVFDYKTGEDLCTSSYYTNAVPIIETQIAKAGYRLAAWLNVLFDGKTALS